jgi:hypothetical protein
MLLCPDFSVTQVSRVAAIWLIHKEKSTKGTKKVTEIASFVFFVGKLFW